MEFNFDINELLPDEITVVDSKLYPFKAQHVKEKGLEILKKNLEQVIDQMGFGSSKAQGLKVAITNAGKLSVSNHRLYLLKDSVSNNGKGTVIGLIKVGKKRLFLVDIHSQQLEVNPLCVLDFYVHERCQRNGYGHRLFNFMLEREGVKPQFLAYDRPSSKFINFLKKYCGLQNPVNQMNNFLVFDLFFRDLSAVGYVPSHRRFVSSAPSDSRVHPASGSSSMQAVDSQLICTATTYSRMKNGSLKDLRINDRSSTDYLTTLHNTDSSRFQSLPPQCPGRSSSFHKETTWSRRNGSHIHLTSSPGENASGIQSPVLRNNMYSRHSFSKLQKAQDSGTKMSESDDKSTARNDTNLGIYGRNEQTRKHMSPTSNSKSHPGLKSNVKPPGSSRNSLPQKSSDQSYSVDRIHRQATFSHNISHGTSWNIFGVPASLNRHGRASSRNANN